MNLGFTGYLVYTQGSFLSAFVMSGRKAHYGTEKAAQGHADNKSYQRRSPHRQTLRLHPSRGKREVIPGRR